MNEFINFSSAKILGVDLETHDPLLIEEGPGWGRGVGHILGVSIAADHNNWTYIEVGKKPSPQVLSYLTDTLGTNSYKVGANLQYDFGWLSEIGIYPKGQILDVQFAEALLDDVLIDSYGRKLSVSLDSLAQRYLGRSKEKTEIEAYCKARWPWSKDFRENLWRCPPELVAAYAGPDAWLPIEIIRQQWVQLQKEDLLDLFFMECALIPVLVKMRRRGTPVNVTRAHEVRDELLLMESLAKRHLANQVGFKFNAASGKDLERVCKKCDIVYEKTAKGNPSFTAPWLNSQDHPILTQIVELRKIQKTRSTFIENAIIEKSINGKVFTNFHPLRAEEHGTISGRFSSTQPNLQQISKRDKVWGPLLRSLFIPEPGYPSWLCLDLSQIEYRLFAHYSDDLELIKAYQDPAADFHSIVGSFIGSDIPRIAAKTINFGILYGMGKDKLLKELVKYFPTEKNPGQRAIQIYSTYQKQFPVAKRLLTAFANIATMPPHEVRTILGRKSRFKLWESSVQRGTKPLPLGLATREYNGLIQIAGSYKAINRVLQGGAADLMKKAMLDCETSGLFDRVGYPHITVHDELDFSYHPDLHADFMEVIKTFEQAIPLKVPVIMNAEIGPNWSMKE